MDQFCGSKFWDLNVTWYTHSPDFTPCFEKTVLTWVPCSFLWFCAGFVICRAVRSAGSNGPVPNSMLNICTRLFTTVLIIVSIARVIYPFIIDTSWVISPVDYVSPAVQAATYTLALLVISINKQRGVVNSGVLFVFWFLNVICGVFEFQSALRNLPVVADSDHEKCSFLLLMISYPVVVVQLFLHSFTDVEVSSTASSETKPCPQLNASLPSRIFFHWIWSIVYLGYKKPLEFADLWDLNPEERSHVVVEHFESYWKPEFDKCQRLNKQQVQSNIDGGSVEDDDALIVPDKKKPKKIASILPALWKCYWKPFFWADVLYLMSRTIQFASPQILHLLINHVNSTEEAWKGYFYAFLMLSTTSLNVLLAEHYFIIMQFIGARTRSALSSAVYRKSLVISNASRKEATAGEIVNLMSVDSQRFMDVMMYVNTMWSAPFEIGLALYFLYQLLGPSTFAGLGVLILLVPITAVMANVREKLQTNQMKAKDERVKLINEVLSGIRVLKFYAWETSFEEEIHKIRQKEINIFKKQAYIDAFGEFVWFTSPFLVTFVTFATYVLSDSRNVLDASKAFVAIALFNLVRAPMNTLPWVIAQIIQAKVSLVRLNKFLNSDEVDKDAVTHHTSEHGISIEDGVFCWEDNPTLRNINFHVKKGSLVAVVGVVGSGKSSLLGAILGELETQSGTVNTLGSIAYVAQQAWIQNDTIQGNILFGKKLDTNLYNKVIRACALQPDLDILPGGDKTEIGEKGINLSGGQKQRVALARAVYNDADMYLLDDPLSAVDSHVGKHLFEQVIGPEGMLNGKTRVLVTHGLTYLPRVDCIVVMKNGEISEVGTFQDLLKEKGDFAEFLNEYLSPDDIAVADNELVSQIESLEGLKDKVRRCRLISQASEDEKVETMPADTEQTPSTADRLIDDETAEVGRVKTEVYFYYLRHVGWTLALSAVLLHSVQHGLVLFSNIWLAIWSVQPAVNGTQDIGKRDLFLGVYGGLGFAQGAFVLLSTATMILASLKAAKLLHNLMLKRILRSPMSFFDTTPLGRIVNRFSKDVDVADETFPWNLRMLITCLFEVITAFVAIIYSTPWFTTVIVPIILVYFFIQRFYVASSRQLKRLESVSRSPVYSHFSETLTGAATIRAFRAQNSFMTESERTIDSNLRAFYPSIIANRWLAICLELLGNAITFFAALFAVIFRPSQGVVGLSITCALNMLEAFNWLVRQISAVETNVVAIERIKEYGEAPQEAPWDIPQRKPARNWPQNGAIEFNNFQTRYREGLELVLKGISCQINPGEKVGIVGRTGAGKSSMTLGLFRIIEAAGGSIVIDGVDISKPGLHDVRGKLTIIPQDPVLFAGTLRMNLDPFGKYADSEVWSALEFAHLKDVAQEFSAGLEHIIAEGGENLSVGQRQLVCLARALLRKTKILILDEATAAVDLATDDLIQQTIRREFKECTVLTIAHRINTIMDYNRVMVLDKGEIREFDSPSVLLQDTASTFYSMAKNAGLV